MANRAAGSPSVGIMLYRTAGDVRDAFAEDKYRGLAHELKSKGFAVRTLSYHDSIRDQLESDALECDAVLVWINPIEPGLDRSRLDEFLRKIAAGGVLVSAHPDTILRMGTKDVLFETKDVDWSTDVRTYRTFTEFREGFPNAIETAGPRVLKQYRGNGGQGVWKISVAGRGGYLVESAGRDDPPRTMSKAEMEDYFVVRVFASGSHLIDQAWVPSMTRGMVRAYLVGAKVAGFGFQEVVALHQDAAGGIRPPSPRHYYSEQCDLFRSLRVRLESQWVPQMAKCVGVKTSNFPLLWDADFFFADAPQEFVLCEINASCVSPFPESVNAPLVVELQDRLKQRTGARKG